MAPTPPRRRRWRLHHHGGQGHVAVDLQHVDELQGREAVVEAALHAVGRHHEAVMVAGDHQLRGQIKRQSRSPLKTQSYKKQLSELILLQHGKPTCEVIQRTRGLALP